MRSAPAPSPPSVRRTALALVAAGAALALGAGEARAQEAGDVLPPNTHSAWYLGSIGPSINLDGAVTQFSLVNEAGWHLSNRSDGPAIGGSFHLGFGRGLTRISPQARFWWDIPVAGRLPIYVAPTAGFGYNAFVVRNVFVGGRSLTLHSAAFQVGVVGRAVIKNRGFVSFQPLGFEIFAGDGETTTNYNLLFGGGFVFY